MPDRSPSMPEQAGGRRRADKVLRVLIVLLLTTAIFDPGDKIWQLKVPLFAAVCFWCVFRMIIHKRSPAIPTGLVGFVAIASIVLPMLSTIVYFFRGGTIAEYDGLVLWKAYLFLAFAFVLLIEGFDILLPLCSLLSVLSVAIAILFSVLSLYPVLLLPLAIWGEANGVFNVDMRTYGRIEYPVAYFVASPMLVLAIAYFMKRWLESGKKWHLFLVSLNCAGMFLSGTRNNIVLSVVTPVVVLLWYSKRKLLVLSVVSCLLIGVGAMNAGTIAAALDPKENSNDIKVQHLRDYWEMLSHPATLVFGDGIGSRFFSRGFADYTSVSELTYLEIVREYGLLLSAVIALLLLYPLSRLRDPAARSSHYVFLAYACYLYVCALNPLLFSSSGMIILSAVLYHFFMVRPRPDVAPWAIQPPLAGSPA